MRNRAVIMACIALAFGARPGFARQTVRRADIDSSGQLRIVLSDKRVISPPKDSDQVGFEQLLISPDRRVVGWVARYPNCCTTYAIPLKLVLLRADGGRSVISNDMPIWQWAFAVDGRNVVIQQAPVHGAAPTSYERRDIRTGRVTAAAQADSSADRGLPAWTRAAQSRPQLAGRWRYLQPPDHEGEVLDLSVSSGQWRGIMNGLLRAGEHGVRYYVVEVENLIVDPDGSIRFEIGERPLAAKRPALSVVGGKADAGIDRYRMRFSGKIEAGNLVLHCTDRPGDSCPASSMTFKRM